MSSRRQFIKDISIFSLAFVNSDYRSNHFSQIGDPKSKIKIVVVGGGLAGLRATYLLSKNDRFEVKLVEGSNRLGGRIFTDRDFFSTNTTVELGGEFIDTAHKDMWDLIKEFNLTTIDTWQYPQQLSSYDVFINGKNRNKEYEREWSKWSPLIELDKQKINDLNYRQNLNNSSLKEYLDNLKITGWFRDYLRWIFTAEYGLDYSEINCLCLHEMIGSHKDGSESKLTLFQDVTDQRYKIKGGNDKLITAIANQIKPNTHLERKLISIRLNENKYHLHFSDKNEEQADYVIIALPLSILRNIKLEGFAFSRQKRHMIDYSSYGTNSKVILGFKDRIWRISNNSIGSVITDSLQSGWDSSILQNDDKGPGTYTFFMGGYEGKSVSSNSDHVQRCLKKIDLIYSGASKYYNGDYKIYNWNDNDFAKGSYLSLKAGEWFTYDYDEWQKPEGRIYFAGEHCSKKYQGFMNGAAESASITVNKLVKDITEHYK